MTAIFFVHQGISAYLSDTLRIASVTNPNEKRVLIGDASNLELASACGWTHVDFTTLQSKRISTFRDSFRLVSSTPFRSAYLAHDLTRLCFERYEYGAMVAKILDTDRFWLLDSDDIIAEPLRPFEETSTRRGLVCTRMAHNTALRGMMDVETCERFFTHSTGLFSDAAFVDRLEAEMASQDDKMAAFTDMNAASLLEIAPGLCQYLATAIDGWHFDDCVLHTDDFEMTDLGHITRLPVKHIRFDGRHFTGIRAGESIKLATVNGSGLPRQIFRWFLDCVVARSQGRPIQSDIRAYQPSLLREALYLTKSRLVRAVVRSKRS